MVFLFINKIFSKKEGGKSKLIKYAYENALLYSPESENIFSKNYTGDVLLPIGSWLITDEFFGRYMCLKLVEHKALVVIRSLDYSFIINLETKEFIEEGESRKKFKETALKYLEPEEYALYKNCFTENKRFMEVLKSADIITNNKMYDIYNKKILNGVENIVPINDIFNGCLDNMFKRTLPFNVGTSLIHYFSYNEIENTIESINSSRSSQNISPYWYSPTISVSIYKDEHSYWPNEIHIIVFPADGADKSNLHLIDDLVLKNTKTAREVVVDFIWKTLKEIYNKNLNVDIDKMKLIDKIQVE